MSILSRAKEKIMSTMNLVRSNGRSGKKTEPVKKSKVVTSIRYSDNPSIDATAKAIPSQPIKTQPTINFPTCHVCDSPMAVEDRHNVKTKSGNHVVVCGDCLNKAKERKQQRQVQSTPTPVKTEPKPEIKPTPVSPTPPVERSQAKPKPVDKRVENVPVQTLVSSGSSFVCDHCHTTQHGPVASFHYQGKRYCKYCWRQHSDNPSNAPTNMVKVEPKPTPVKPVAPVKAKSTTAKPKTLPSVVCPRCKRNVPGLLSSGLCQICENEDSQPDPVKTEPKPEVQSTPVTPAKTKEQLRKELLESLAKL